MPADHVESSARRVDWSRNTGKYRIQRDLLAITEPIRILDVGAVGTGPLDLWRSLPLADLPFDVVAIDNDAANVEQARSLGLGLELRALSGYELIAAFGRDAFDLVICTQVLEHVAKPQEFLRQIAGVLPSGGELWMTVDSGHFSTSHAGDALWKRTLRPVAAKLSERYYDFGLTERELEAMIGRTGLTLMELIHCNLGPVKPMVSEMSDEQVRDFMPIWYQLEVELDSVAEPTAFRGIYIRAHMNAQ